MPLSTESFRIKKDLLAEIRKVAKATGRTIQMTVERWIRRGLKEEQHSQEQAQTEK